MRIVAAGVHLSRIAGSKGEAGFFVDGQGVHICAECHTALTVAFQRTQYTRFCKSARFYAETRQNGFCERGCLVFFERQFGICVDGTPKLDKSILSVSGLLKKP